MTQISIWMSFAAGVVSFLSPCVLPLVPGYVSFMSGLSLEELTRGADRKAVIRRAGLGSIFFVLGFSAVFTALGASASAVGRMLEAYMPVLSKLAGAVIVVFGLHMMGLFQLRWLPFLKGVGRIKGQATAYVCVNYACELPTNKLDTLSAILDGRGPSGG